MWLPIILIYEYIILGVVLEIDWWQGIFRIAG